MRTNALRVAAIALRATVSSRRVDSLAIRVESLGVSIEAMVVGVAAMEVSIEVSQLAYPLGTASLSIRPETSSAWTPMALVVVAPAPALALGRLLHGIITKGHCAYVNKSWF